MDAVQEGKHLPEHWHKGKGGQRAEGEDLEEDQARLRELEERQVGCQLSWGPNAGPHLRGPSPEQAGMCGP